MEDSIKLVSASICLFLSVLCLAVNGPTVVNILLRPTLRTTLNNLTCALLTVNLAFGSVHFLLLSLKVTGSGLLLSNHLCSGLVIVPQFFRIISLYILMGSLFLRSLFVKHAKYISLVSKRNHLVISDFGLPIWITIFTFVLLNILFMLLHTNFPDNFPNVRLCLDKEPFRNKMDEDLYLQTILTTSSGSIILATFVVSVHLRLHDYLRRYHQRSLNNFRQNVTTAKQTILACYIKLTFALVNCSLLHVQVRQEPGGVVTNGLMEMLEMLAMTVECVLVPSFWLAETRSNFPELTSSNNSILRNVFFPNSVDISVIPLQELPSNNNERPLSPRRPAAGAGPDILLRRELMRRDMVRGEMLRRELEGAEQVLGVYRQDMPPIII